MNYLEFLIKINIESFSTEESFFLDSTFLSNDENSVHTLDTHDKKQIKDKNINRDANKKYL